jgi:hypothetical protein
MAQINYIEPIKYNVIENGELLKENIVPRCILHLTLHKQFDTVNRAIEFPDYDITIPVGIQLS